MTLVLGALVLNSKALHWRLWLDCTNEAYGVQLGTNCIQASGDTAGANDLLAYAFTGLDQLTWCR